MWKLKQNICGWRNNFFSRERFRKERRGGKKLLRRSYRGKFLNEVMGHMHQILILSHVLLKTSIFLLLQQVKVVGSIEQGLDEPLPGAESRDLRGHCRAHSRTDHQHQLRGSLSLQAGQQLPLGQAGIEQSRSPRWLNMHAGSCTWAYLGFLAFESASWESAAGRFSVFTVTTEAIQLL